MARKQAKQGGEQGTNGAQYKGGQFLPVADPTAYCAKRKSCYGCPMQAQGRCPEGV